MAVPFRRKSSTRIKKARGTRNWKFVKKFTNQPLVNCFHCQTKKLLHQVCPSCLRYRELNFQKTRQEEKEIE